MTDLKKMTVAASGKLRQVAYDILNEQTRLLSWQQGGKVPQEQFDSWLAEAEGLYSIGNIKVDEAFLAKAPKLKVIAQASVGYDNIDIAACSAHGIAAFPDNLLIAGCVRTYCRLYHCRPALLDRQRRFVHLDSCGRLSDCDLHHLLDLCV